RRHGERSRARNHRTDRNGRRDRSCDRICGRSGEGAFDGRPHDALQHEHRRGARAGMIAPDETTFSYLKGRRYSPNEKWEEAVRYWRTLPSDDDAQFDRVVNIDATTIAPCVTWGTNPGMVVPVTGAVPDPSDAQSEAERRAFERALEYMGY